MKAFAVAVVTLCASITGAAQSPAPVSLPDWSGIWAMQGNTVFDRATVQPPTGRAGEAGVRESPPYNEEWEAIYRKNIERVSGL